MSDLVERMARAMAVADGKDPDAPAWVRQPGNQTFGICWRDQYAKQAQAALDASGLIEERDGLREALEPFAKAADIKLCGEWQDDKHFGQTDVGFYLTFGDLRRARAALSRASLDHSVEKAGQ